MSNNNEGNKDNKDLMEEDIQEKEMESKSESLEDNLESKDKEIEELNNKLLRLQADFVNFKKRTEKEKESTISYALESFVCSLLPIIDNFQRAMESEDNKESGFYQGIEMIYQQLMKVLNENNIEEIKSLGENFDPNFHHAVFMEESDEYEEGKITEVLQKGYMLKDKVIRPSMVKVAK
ncbi:nucleotide exchange factor GrpE [Tissierella praeacuta]|uniref:Protein GrpE n=1 Tax=Tissierella praeacuta DSM 18095 TaxID=1123404 RepID=A0A1M4S896_9FIRM|nr:nucleotide exchange factor GrpE [Tissierella praeacuta]MBU5256800.1 nucleotide exchange factor GrpE [Tissierella praeacuta]TCU71711.1 molecular chaperone GrpE [Tissierella praeacuta]SHE28436.1 molecular chaperone GrpE [Tissierella praeacuta DSM 18095]SUP01100.1 HSP-70 cofactor [Tissierella praeacuta]